jgi:hypothetical protein
MEQICPMLKQPCIKQDCEMWLSTEIDMVDDKGNHDKKLNFDDCAFRIIAGRPRYAQPEEDPREKMDSGSMTGS